MTAAGVAFEIIENDDHILVGYTKSSGHLIFDIKMDFTGKARWVKDGHRTPDPKTSNCAGVVSRERFSILLTHAAFHLKPVKAADICSAYLHYPASEEYYILLGPEFRLENVGKRAKIVRALYGGKSSGSYFWSHLCSCMAHLGLESSKSNTDFWMR